MIHYTDLQDQSLDNPVYSGHLRGKVWEDPVAIPSQTEPENLELS